MSTPAPELLECVACGGRVSSAASACPLCGQPGRVKPRGSSIAAGAMVGFGWLLVFLAIYAGGQGHGFASPDTIHQQIHLELVDMRHSISGVGLGVSGWMLIVGGTIVARLDDLMDR